MAGELDSWSVLTKRYQHMSDYSHLVAKSVDAGWARLVADAGAAGLAGVDCSVLYRGCHGHLDTDPN